MIRLTHVFIAFGLTGVVAAPGCGEEGPADGSGSGALSSGLPKDQVVGTLSDGDVQKWCAAISDYVASDPAIHASLCHFAGFTLAAAGAAAGTASDADLQNTCTQIESACMNARAQVGDGGASTCRKPSGTCDVTIGELEACITDSMTALETAFATLPSCATLRTSDVTSGATMVPQAQSPASCEVVTEKCPDAMQSSGLPQSGSPTGTGS